MHRVPDTGDVEQHVISAPGTSTRHVFSGKKWNSLTFLFPFALLVFDNETLHFKVSLFFLSSFAFL